MNNERRFLIVTPTFNAIEYIHEAIWSVMGQSAGGLEVLYHVQDGGSLDGTPERVAQFSASLHDLVGAERPKFRIGLAQEPDNGMYDAITRGFEKLEVRDSDILTWINSDDLLAPGALSTVLQVMSDVPQCEFLSGRVVLANAAGSITSINAPSGYSRELLAAGRHDGRNLPFIMQEGTFFSGRLWLRVGGADSAFKLAGDWDLWRRMAAIAPHYTIDTILGLHRRHPGQLTEGLSGYYAEVDAALLRGNPRPEPKVVAANLVRYDGIRKRWISASFEAGSIPPPVLLGNLVYGLGCEIAFEAGFSPPEGPYPEYGLLAPIRWMSEPRAFMMVRAPQSAAFRCRLRVRPAIKGVRLAVAVNGAPIINIAMPEPRSRQDEVLEFCCWLSAGNNEVELFATANAPQNRRIMLLQAECFAEMAKVVSSRMPVAKKAANRLRLTIICKIGNSETHIWNTLESVAECIDELDHVELRGCCDCDFQSIFRTYSSIIDVIATSSVQINLTDGFSFEIQAGDRLVKGFLSRAAAIAEAHGFSQITALVDLADDFGQIRNRKLPREERSSRFRYHSVENEFKSFFLGETSVIAREASLVSKESDCRAPAIWLFEKKTFERNGPCLEALAAAFALLGANIFRVEVDSEASFDGFIDSIDRDAHVICNWEPGQRSGDRIVAVERRSSDLILSSAGQELQLLVSIDTRVYRPRSKWLSRYYLGVSQETLVVVTNDESIATIQAADLDFVRGERDMIVAVASLQRSPVGDKHLRYFRATDDNDVMALWISASDFVIAEENTMLSLKAEASGVQVGPNMSLAPNIRQALTPCARDFNLRQAMVSSYETLAARLTEQAPIGVWSAKFADWLASRRFISAQPVKGRFIGPGNWENLQRLVPHSTNIWPTVIPAQASNSISDWPAAIRVIGHASLLLESPRPFTALRLFVDAKDTCVWNFAIDEEVGSGLSIQCADRMDVLLERRLPPGLHRLTLNSPLESAVIDVLTWEIIGEYGQAPLPLDRAGTVELVPAFGQFKRVLEEEGDWRFHRGFYKMEAAHPELGFHSPFRWSRGRRSSLQIRIERPGKRQISLAVSGVVAGQRVRLRFASQTTEWSQPMGGVLGRVQIVLWALDLPSGDCDVVMELSSSTVTGENRDLGIILHALSVSFPIFQTPDLSN